jgi:hypothetical protein
VYHDDIQSEHVFFVPSVTLPQQPCCIIIDYGMSKFISKAMLLHPPYSSFCLVNKFAEHEDDEQHDFVHSDQLSNKGTFVAFNFIDKYTNEFSI